MKTIKTITTLIAGIIALLTLSAVAFAADEEIKDLGPAIWADQYGTYTADGSGEIKFYPYETVDIGPAIWADEFGTYTADGSGEIKFYPNKAVDIGPAIWADEFGTYTADGSGEIKFYPNKAVDLGPAIWADETGVYTTYTDGTITVVPTEPAYKKITSLQPWAYNHSAVYSIADIGTAIWTDGEYIYTAGDDGVIAVIPCEPAVWVAPATK